MWYIICKKKVRSSNWVTFIDLNLIRVNYPNNSPTKICSFCIRTIVLWRNNFPRYQCLGTVISDQEANIAISYWHQFICDLLQVGPLQSHLLCGDMFTVHWNYIPRVSHWKWHSFHTVMSSNHEPIYLSAFNKHIFC